MSALKKTITVQVGCRTEWRALEGALDAITSLAPEASGPFSHYQSLDLEGVDLIAFQGGPSKTIAGAACQHALSTHKPDLHVMLGTCGGVSGRPGVGGLMYADRAAQYDCIDRLCDTNDFFYDAFDVHIDNSWIREVLEPLGLVAGTVATADQDIDFSVRKTLMSHGADAADWESAAVALVCHHNQVPVLILRGVSDIPEEDLSQVAQAESFINRTPMIMKAFAGILPAIAKQLTLRQPLSNTIIPLYSRPFELL